MWWLAACAPVPVAPAPDPGCARLFSVDLPADGLLGDASDTALAFAPGGEQLLVGAAGGRLLLLDAATGEVLAEQRLAESLIRAVAFAADGAVVYAAEQSADAFVHAFDARDLAPRGRYRLADEVGTSPPPRPDDPWGVYQLPAAYHLLPRTDGVVAVATHGWTTAQGRRNASRVVRLAIGPHGLARAAAWPADGAADAVFGAATAEGDALAVAIRRSADGPPPADLPIDGVQRLRLPELAPVGAVVVPPLPGYGSVFVWDALAVRGDALLFGTGDGRLILASSGPPRIIPYAVPAGASAVPVAASVGFLRADGDAAFTVTSRSWSPGSADGSAIPTSLHPEERSVASWSWTGDELAPRWAWRGPYDLSGLAVAASEVVVGAGPRSDDRTDLFGFLRFPRGGGAPVVCATEGAVAAAPAVTADGRVAIVEVPTTVAGVRAGPYRVSVWR